MDNIQVRNEGAIRWLVFDRDERANALTTVMRDVVINEVTAANSDPGVRAIVLTANGKRFCSGADLSDVKRASNEFGAGDLRNIIRNGAQRLIKALWNCQKPIVCGLNGTAAGIGAHMALACDLVVAAESAKLIEVFGRRGLIPDGGGPYLLTRLIGPQRTKELMFFADDVSSQRAFELGLVNTVVSDGEFQKTLIDWANRLAAGPTRMYGFTRYLVNHALDSDLETAFEMEANFVELNSHTKDQREGVTAFLERRDPEFTGF